MDKNAKPTFGLSNKKNQISAQSSLGELGSSLLKFFKPAVRVKAHTTQFDYLTKAQGGEFAAADVAKVSAPGDGKIIKAGTASAVKSPAAAAKPAPGQVGSGVITVARDPSTPWVQVMTGLIDSCQQSKVATQSAMGAQQYRSATENRSAMRRKTVGRIINIMSEEDAPPVVEEKKGDEGKKENATVAASEKKAA